MGAPVGALVEALVGALALVGSRLVGAAWWKHWWGSWWGLGRALVLGWCSGGALMGANWCLGFDGSKLVRAVSGALGRGGVGWGPSHHLPLSPGPV
jgi:hypothetical protein